MIHYKCHCISDRKNAGVLFASIPNFAQSCFSANKNLVDDDIQLLNDIKLLNDIIVKFDHLLDFKKFQTIEKIKTVGTTYMAASGIDPVNSAKDELAHICDLVDFAIKMSVILEEINQKTGNDFKLRIGKY